MSATAPATPTEDLASFRQRAREWIRGNLRPASAYSGTTLAPTTMTQEEELAEVTRDRQLQRKLYDAGFAGLCVPTEYGGHGLPAEYQRAFNEELAGREYPSRLQAPTFSPCLAVLLDFGTEEQKLEHIPKILTGEEIWMQFLSEPSGGSDVAGALTSATRHGDEWVLNGSKIWTTGAWWSDWALCLARTNWEVPKHRGLSVFILPLNREGVAVHRIEMLNGCMEFCQEFLTDVRVPDTDRIGDVDGGWTVGTRWLFHERMLHNSPYVTLPNGSAHGGARAASLVDLARGLDRLADPGVRDLLGEARMLEIAQGQLSRRVRDGIGSGKLNDQGAAIGRLFTGVSSSRMSDIGYEIAGGLGAVWAEDDDAGEGAVTDFLMRQVSQIGGGTTEMARNVVAERVLGMPRERAQDKDVPFREVPRGSTARG